MQTADKTENTANFVDLSSCSLASALPCPSCKKNCFLFLFLRTKLKSIERNFERVLSITPHCLKAVVGSLFNALARQQQQQRLWQYHWKFDDDCHPRNTDEKQK